MREHRFLGAGVVVPLVQRGQVHGAELPLLERMHLALQKAAALLFLADREPELDQVDAAADQVAFKIRHLAQEIQVFVLGAEAHDSFHAGAVVPGTVEHDDLARGRQMLHIALEIPLASLRVGGLFQRDHARAARVQVFHHAFDGAALAGGITAFEQDHHPLAGGLDPRLQLQQFDLQVVLLLLVIAAQHAVAIGIDAFAPIGRQFVVGIAARAWRHRIGLQQRAVHGLRIVRGQVFDHRAQCLARLRRRADVVAAGNIGQHGDGLLARRILAGDDTLADVESRLGGGRRGHGIGSGRRRLGRARLAAGGHRRDHGLDDRLDDRCGGGAGGALGGALARRFGYGLFGGLACLVCHRCCPRCADRPVRGQACACGPLRKSANATLSPGPRI